MSHLVISNLTSASAGITGVAITAAWAELAGQHIAAHGAPPHASAFIRFEPSDQPADLVARVHSELMGHGDAHQGSHVVESHSSSRE